MIYHNRSMSQQYDNDLIIMVFSVPSWRNSFQTEDRLNDDAVLAAEVDGPDGTT